MDPHLETPPRKKLKIAEPAILSLVIWGAYTLFISGISDHCRARAGTAAHLISQIDQALESYQTDYGAYPPGDGSGSKEVVSTLSKPGPKKAKYFEFVPELIRSGNIANPTWPDGDPPKDVIYYRCPGIHRPTRFDLWAEDCQGNPEGINNW
jgi:type II secretory pathway pseudopilin PulG